MTPNYEYIQNLIKNTLANKPIGHEITPEEHQNIELALLEYAKNLELLQVGTLIGFADANTVPVQPNGTNAAYLNTMTNSTTTVFHNFRDINGKQISVTTDNEHAALNILFWNAGNKNQRNGWTVYTTQIHITAIADLSYILEKITLQEDFITNVNCGGIKSGTLLPSGTELKQIITDMLFGSEVIQWGENSNANNYTETGIFHFAGYRTNVNDNLPIDNADEKANIAFTLIVDKSEGYLEGSTHVPTIVSQTLFLGNRQGSETRAYVRNCTIFFDDQPDKWEPWRELMQTTYLGVLRETHEGETLKSVRENGLYTGAFFYPSSTFDIFKLEVMNNYAIADLYGGTNTVFQKITILQINGDDKELTRRRKWNADINDYEWTPWEEITDEDKQDLVADAVENNVATFDADGQVKDSGVKAGGAQFVEESYLCLKTVGSGEPTYYTTVQEMVIPVGTTVYSDAAWTNEVGTVTAAMSSGQYSVALNSGETARVYSASYNKPSDKTLATEAGVMKAIQSAGTSNVSTPDWNQNDETATDYIKNRTHYEVIAEHVEMTDSEYDAKVASGSKFVEVKLNSVTVESNEYLKDGSAGTETGSKQEYDSILSALSAGSDGNVFKNGTSTCKKIAINGIETTLEYLEHQQGSPFYDREGVLGGTFYGADGTADITATNIICCYGNGFMLKYYCHVEYGKPGYFLYLIDKTIYGEAPYTIDFYFECEQTIKKLDKKFLPDEVFIPDAVEDNVVTFATEGRLKDSGKKVGGEEFGKYEQIPVVEVVGNGHYSPANGGKLYGYTAYNPETGISYLDRIVFKEKECLTPIGKTIGFSPDELYYLNTEGDINSGLSSNYVATQKANIVNYLTGKRIIDANTIATEKGVANFLTTFNLVTPKFKTGDVVYCTNVPNFHFGLMTWEDYERTPYNSMDTKMPIGLVVDPIKRTFLFCELLDKYFATSDNIETYFGGYTSFEDGAETFERISKLKATNKAADIPAFYGIRNSGYAAGSIFYVKNDVAYVPSIEEWRKAKEHLCTAFYTDENDVNSPYAGFMDRLIALKNGATPSSSLFIGKHNNGVSKLFYSQLSTVGKINNISGNLANAAYNMNGDIPFWDNAIDQYACCPVFGIYTEAEENA